MSEKGGQLYIDPIKLSYEFNLSIINYCVLHVAIICPSNIMLKLGN